MNPIEAIKTFLLGSGQMVNEDTPTGYKGVWKQQEPDILQRIQQLLGGFSSPQPTSTPTPTPITSSYSTSAPTQSPMPTATPRPSMQGFQDLIGRGLQKSGFGNAPIAGYQGNLAEAGRGLSGQADDLLPTIVALMESGGLRDPKPQTANNPYNIFVPGTQTPVQYPDVGSSMMNEDPNNTLNLTGLLRSGGLYQDYLDSGDISKFFGRFTPESDPNNPSNEELVKRYNFLRQYFQ